MRYTIILIIIVLSAIGYTTDITTGICVLVVAAILAYLTSSAVKPAPVAQVPEQPRQPERPRMADNPQEQHWLDALHYGMGASQMYFDPEAQEVHWVAIPFVDLIRHAEDARKRATEPPAAADVSDLRVMVNAPRHAGRAAMWDRLKEELAAGKIVVPKPVIVGVDLAQPGSERTVIWRLDPPQAVSRHEANARAKRARREQRKLQVALA
ncbi:hypothetical protein [Massilia sp. TSP1-1-2]|uniref:hypothetical protein n=1 Tax=Massilia sp. TSP1-1-2 TaxID=2804649 RepID=UPI003CED7557